MGFSPAVAIEEHLPCEEVAACVPLKEKAGGGRGDKLPPQTLSEAAWVSLFTTEQGLGLCSGLLLLVARRVFWPSSLCRGQVREGWELHKCSSAKSHSVLQR